ncbi:MAG TPA: type VI secretion system-associated protein TagF [Acetobacteraceae bacterium]
MPGVLTPRPPAAPPPGDFAAGLYGKLPARGDFVRLGLPRDFTDPWDAWLQVVLTGSRCIMGEAWLPAFLEAPVWRFSLPPGMCGPWAALGLMLPSVDRAGRYFPLTFAALQRQPIDQAACASWLGACETAGRSALENDTSPEEVAAMLGEPDLRVDATGTADAEWWSEGSARVSPARMLLRCMPDPATYAAMLGAENETEAGGRTWESTS